MPGIFQALLAKRDRVPLVARDQCKVDMLVNVYHGSNSSLNRPGMRPGALCAVVATIQRLPFSSAGKWPLFALRSATWHILVSVEPADTRANSARFRVAAVFLRISQRDIAFDRPFVSVVTEANDPVNSRLVCHVSESLVSGERRKPRDTMSRG